MSTVPNSQSDDEKGGWLGDLLNNFVSSAKNIQDVAKATTGLVNAGAASASSSASTGSSAFSSEATAARTEGQAQQDVTQITGEAAIKQKNDDALAAQTLGVDREGFAKSSKELVDVQNEILGYNQQLKQMAGATLFTDPFNWIVNQFREPVVEGKRNAAVLDYLDRTKFMENSQDHAKQEFAIDATLDNAVGTNLIAAQKRVIAAQTTQKADEATERGQQFNINAMNAVTAMTSAQFDISYKAATLQEQAVTAGAEFYRGQYYQAMIPNKAIQTEEEKARLQELNIKNQTLEQQNQTLKDLSGFLGMTPMSVGTYGGMTGKMQQTLETINANRVTSGSIGSDPIESLSLAKAAGINPLTAGEQLTRDYISKSTADTENLYQNVWKTYTPDQRILTLNKELLSKIDKDIGDVSKPGSIYSTPALATALKIPLLANTKIGQALLPLSNPGGKAVPDYRVNGTDLIGAAKSLIASGKATVPEMSAELVQWGKSLQMATNVAGSLQRYHMPLMGREIQKYNMIVPSEGYLGLEHKTLDFVNPAQVETFLTREFKTEQDKQQSKAFIDAINPVLPP